ncbi:MAG TPA: DUF3037 domain-containing protein [Thermoanaerobaculia bacterium]|nr:DUF3037 domain-containing protein [Thermoanaerobaculia bacterium]
MKKPYSYVAIKYVHDPVADETLNIGVLVYARESSFVEARFEYNYERYSQTFANFDSQRYREVLRNFEAIIEELREQLAAGDLFSQLPSDARAIVAKVWPDAYLSFRSGPTLRGVTANLAGVASELFNRFVESQYTSSRQVRRSDEEVWGTYRRKLLGTAVPRAIREKTFSTEALSVTFPHCVKNEKWHVLHPISFDYARSSSIADTAAKWLGETTVLADNEEMRNARLYLLLGAPSDKRHVEAYTRAKRILEKIPIPHSMYEEHQVNEFAAELAEHVQPDDSQAVEA